jgi:16S rRNA (guanine966-N2)-methyltransferase
MQTHRPGKIRIIGGKWRGRRLSVPDVETLRPTPDRVRETLFNWLQPFIEGARCLDLFAGTGVLGLEASSRGAAEVVLVENNCTVASQLAGNIKNLEATAVRLYRDDAFGWLQQNKLKFDIVFLDPPFSRGLIDKCCALLRSRGSLNKNALVYIEAEKTFQIPDGLVIKKQDIAGQVKYMLLKTRTED